MPTFTAKSIDTSIAGQVDVFGNFTGTATGGAYDVPARFIYPVTPTTPSNRTIIEPINNVLHETFGSFAPFIFETSRTIIGDLHLVRTQGHALFLVDWYKFSLETMVASGLPYNYHASPNAHIPPLNLNPGAPAVFNSGWKIAAGTDVYDILKDASEFARTPTIADPDTLSPPAAPAATKVMGFGESQTAQLMRNMVDTGQNSALGGAFPGGLVFDGIVAVVGAGGDRTPTTVAADGFVSYGAITTAATPAAEGPYISVDTESAIYMLDGALARDPSPPSHYRHYEIAGASHIAGEFFLLKSFQAPESMAPVLKAMIDHMINFIDGTDNRPAEVVLDGTPATRTLPLLAGVSPTGIGWWGGKTLNTWLPALDPDDRNITGGIRLPHMKVTSSGGSARDGGAPLGVYRGVDCLTDSLADKLKVTSIRDCLQAPNLFGNEIYAMASGVFAPFTDAELRKRYKNHGKYVSAVEAAADNAKKLGWILQEDQVAFVTEAAAADIPPK